MGMHGLACYCYLMMCALGLKKGSFAIVRRRMGELGWIQKGWKGLWWRLRGMPGSTELVSVLSKVELGNGPEAMTLERESTEALLPLVPSQAQQATGPRCTLRRYSTASPPSVSFLPV